MARSFFELKRNSVRDFENLRAMMRLDLGTHKRTRLRRAGCGNSNTLLHNDVAANHGKMLADDYGKRFGKLARNEALERLRFLTVLHSLVPLDERRVVKAVRRMETALQRAFDGSETRTLGAVEVEIVNIELLRRVSALSEDEARKLDVLEKLSESGGAFIGSLVDGSPLDRGVLVHFHGIVDVRGGSNLLLREKQLRQRLHKVAAWQRSPYQVELKKLFKDRTISKNIRDIASYVTKGGNDQLRYNAGFGRDLAEDLDAKIWRAGTGRADRGGETVSDERGLTVGEIKFLDGVWRTLMDRKRNKRGYLIRIG